MSNITTKEAWSWNPFSSDYASSGSVAKLLDEQSAARTAATAVKNEKINKEMATALLGLGVFGIGAGLTGTKLYNLISGVNPVKNKYKKFGPGPKDLDEDEKIAADGWLKTLSDAVSAGMAKAKSLVPAVPITTEMSENQKAFFVPAALATAGLGLYGGNALVRAIEEKKRKEDIEYELSEAKKDYQRALTGKRAEALDCAFITYEKTKEQKTSKKAFDVVSALGTGLDYLVHPMRAVPGLLPLYSAAVLGTGALSGKMTYDWTRERSRDKALERARRSRARIEDANPLYIDPAQLEAIKALHQKEIEKVKQKELA